jgi:integrase
MTMGELAAEFLLRHQKKPSTMAAYRRQMNHDILPAWASRRARDIEQGDVTELLDTVMARSPTMANRVHILLGAMFQFAAQRSRQTGVRLNPVRGLKRPAGREPTRDRKLSADEVRTLWSVLDHEPQHIADLYRLMLLSAQRVSECMALPWSEIDWDRALWELPANRSKSHRAHTLPLLGRAAAILRRRWDARGEHPFVFPGQRRGRPLHQLAEAHERIQNTCGFRFQKRDLRRTATSGLAECGVSRFVIKTILNHADSEVVGTYDRFDYLEPMRTALAKWDRRLTALVEPEAVESNVVEMRA